MLISCTIFLTITLKRKICKHWHRHTCIKSFHFVAPYGTPEPGDQRPTNSFRTIISCLCMHFLRVDNALTCVFDALTCIFDDIIA